jgi:hypothetical protein
MIQEGVIMAEDGIRLLIQLNNQKNRVFTELQRILIVRRYFSGLTVQTGKHAKRSPASVINAGLDGSSLAPEATRLKFSRIIECYDQVQLAVIDVYDDKDEHVEVLEKSAF